MRVFFITILLILAFNLVCQETIITDYERVYNELEKLEVNFSKHSAVKDLLIEKDSAIFDLVEGDLYLLDPINNSEYMLLFVGNGNFTFTPATDIEKDQMEISFGSPNFNEEITSVLFFIGDKTIDDIKSKYQFTQAAENFKTRKTLENHIKYRIYEDTKYFDHEVLSMLLNKTHNGDIYSSMQLKNGEFVFYEMNPNRNEEITFSRQAKTRYSKYMETVCQQHLSSQYETNTAESYYYNPVYVDLYKIDVNFTKKLYFSATAQLTLKTNDLPEVWNRFLLYEDLEVKSVKYNNTDLEFYKHHDSSNLWIKLPDDFIVNEEIVINIDFEGNLIKSSGNVVAIGSYNNWYPKIGGSSYSNYQIRYTYPSRYSIVSIGDKIESLENDGFTTTLWETKLKTRFAPFNMGKIKDSSIRDPRIPKLEFMMSKINDDLNADIANSLAFYSSKFGKCEAENIKVTEIPYYYAQAYPGFINLSSVTFFYDSTWGENEAFRSFETAHQWWGAGVRHKSYHDQWLSEGLSEFCSWWYTQMCMDNKIYFNYLNDTKDRLLSNRKALFSSGQKASSLSLGHRLSTTRTKGDHYLLVYKKGAWIFHMLRNMMIDLKTMKEDKFEAMLQDYYQTYKGKEASTEDFKRIVEGHIGQKMDWFFDQWVYGSDIPKYDFSYEIQETEDGKYNIAFTVLQSNVPDDFKMYVPLRVEFGKGQQAYIRVKVEGPETKQNIAVPIKPKKVEFNALNSVLAS